jgi:hypothetical protein
MKIKDLILELSKFNPETDISICVYDCGGYNDVYGFEIEAQNSARLYLSMYVGCDTHRKWTSTNKCPVQGIQNEIDKIADIHSSVDYYQKKLEELKEKMHLKKDTP